MSKIDKGGIVGTFKGYDIQVMNVAPGDVIFLHVSEDMSVDECAMIQKEMSKVFPENTVVPVNEYILKGITVIHKSEMKSSYDEVRKFLEETSIEELFPLKPTLYPDKGSSAVPPGGSIW